MDETGSDEALKAGGILLMEERKCYLVPNPKLSFFRFGLMVLVLPGLLDQPCLGRIGYLSESGAVSQPDTQEAQPCPPYAGTARTERYTWTVVERRSIQFRKNSFALTEEAKSQLDELAPIINGQKTARLELWALSSEQGPVRHSVTLESQRISTIRRYLYQTHQVDPWRMQHTSPPAPAKPGAKKKRSTRLVEVFVLKREN